jgi:hypothetical protein
MHLSTGVLVGALILFFSITGALLAYERPIIHAADKRFYQPDPSGPRLPLGEMVARAAQALPASPEMLILHHDPNWPLEIQTADRLAPLVWFGQRRPCRRHCPERCGRLVVSLSARVRRLSLDAGPVGTSLRPRRHRAALRCAGPGT